MKKEKMKYKDRYTTMTIRFKPDEWELFNKVYDIVREATGVDFSKHAYIKALVANGMKREEFVNFV